MVRGATTGNTDEESHGEPRGTIRNHEERKDLAPVFGIHLARRLQEFIKDSDSVGQAGLPMGSWIKQTIIRLLRRS